VGEATVVEEDGQIRLTYTADFKSPSGVNRLGFNDILYALPRRDHRQRCRRVQAPESPSPRSAS
jgi:hypothetical protein